MPAQSRAMNQTCWSSMTMASPQFVPVTMHPPMPPPPPQPQPPPQPHPPPQPQTPPPPLPQHFIPGGILVNGNVNMPFSQPFGMPPHSLYNPQFIHQVDTSVPPPMIYPRIPYPMPVQQQPPYAPSNMMPPTSSVAPTNHMVMTNGSHFVRAPLQVYANAQMNTFTYGAPTNYQSVGPSALPIFVVAVPHSPDSCVNSNNVAPMPVPAPQPPHVDNVRADLNGDQESGYSFLQESVVMPDGGVESCGAAAAAILQEGMYAPQAPQVDNVRADLNGDQESGYSFLQESVVMPDGGVESCGAAAAAILQEGMYAPQAPQVDNVRADLNGDQESGYSFLQESVVMPDGGVESCGAAAAAILQEGKCTVTGNSNSDVGKSQDTAPRGPGAAPNGAPVRESIPPQSKTPVQDSAYQAGPKASGPSAQTNNSAAGADAAKDSPLQTSCRKSQAPSEDLAAASAPTPASSLDTTAASHQAAAAPTLAAKPQGTDTTPPLAAKLQGTDRAPTLAAKPQWTDRAPTLAAKPQWTDRAPTLAAKLQWTDRAPTLAAKLQGTDTAPTLAAKPQGTDTTPALATQPQGTDVTPAVSSPKTTPPKVPAVETKAETGPAEKTAVPAPAGVPAQATASAQAGVNAQAGVPVPAGVTVQAGTSAQPAVPAQEGSASIGPTSPASTAAPKSVWGTRSFADVVRKDTGPKPCAAEVAVVAVPQKAKGQEKPQDKLLPRLREYFLKGHREVKKARNPRIRGLMNTDLSMCYLNCVLQMLVHERTMNSLILNLPTMQSSVRGPSTTPILDALLEFHRKFTPDNLETPFAPGMIYSILPKIGDGKWKGHCDADEFLMYLFDKVQEEINMSVSEPADAPQSDAWLLVRKEKNSFQSFRNPIEEIWSSHVENVSPGSIVPMWTIHIAVSPSEDTSLTLEDILGQAFVEDSNTEKRQQRLARLGRNLLVTLDMFTGMQGNLSKNFRPIKLAEEVYLPEDCVAKHKNGDLKIANRRLNLHVVIFHIGKGFNSGHFVVAKRFASNWVLFNDSTAKSYQFCELENYRSIECMEDATPYLLAFS